MASYSKLFYNGRIEAFFPVNISEIPTFTTIAVAIFFVLNATGQIPIFLALLGRFEQKRQTQIMIRELLIALGVLLVFVFAGNAVLMLLGISRPILGVAGGILLFLISLSMIFPKKREQEERSQEPFIIPLAIPVIAGPGAIATVMLYADKTGSSLLVAGALISAWVLSLIILLLGSALKHLLGERGLVAIERLGGMLVCLIGLQMFTSSLLLLIQDYFQIGV
jgi:multiple antibiotic resistance protein